MLGVGGVARVRIGIVAGTLGWVLFEAGVLLFYVFEEGEAEFFGAFDFVWVRTAENFDQSGKFEDNEMGEGGVRYVKVHRLITFSVRTVLHEPRVSAFDLDAAARFLLDVFDVSTAMTDYLCSQIETGDGLEVDCNTLFGPFALGHIRKSSKLRKCVRIGYILVQIRHARPALVLDVGSVSRQPSLEVLAS